VRDLTLNTVETKGYMPDSNNCLKQLIGKEGKTMISSVKKKAIALMMLFMMTASLVLVFGPAEVSAASGSYKMPTRLKTFEYKNGKWKKTNDRTYKYDSKGNMINWDGTKLKLTYNGSKLKKVTTESRKNSPEHCLTTKVYNSKGNITNITYNYLEFRKIKGTYKYDKKGYIKSYTYNGMDDNGDDLKCVEKYAIKYYKNGMPKQITKTYNYKKEKTVETFNDKGFVTSGKTYEGKKLTDSYTTTYKMSGNQIVSAVENYTVKDGKKSKYKWKYVYTYGKAKTKDMKQYAAIISMTHASFLFQTVGNNSAVGWCR